MKIPGGGNAGSNPNISDPIGKAEARANRVDKGVRTSK